MAEVILSKCVRKVLRLRIEDLARMMMVSVRTVNNWDGSSSRKGSRPSKLHERVLELAVEAGRRDPELYRWVHDVLENGSPLVIIEEILSRARRKDGKT